MVGIDFGKPLFTREEIQRKIQELGSRVSTEYAEKDLLVGVESPPAERQSTDKQGSDGLYYRLWREVDDFSDTGISTSFWTMRFILVMAFPRRFQLSNNPSWALILIILPII